MNKKVAPIAVLLADAALIGTGLIHLYLTAVLAKARASAKHAGETP